MKQTYGLSLARYDQMLAAQGGGCAICGKPDVHRRRLSVDHCHDTGQVRALVCVKCNAAMGQLNDDPALLRRAADYIERHMAAAMVVA